MRPRISLLILAVLVLLTAGCRSGEFKDLDMPIYQRMPDLLAANEFVYDHVEKNEDGSVKVNFEKGRMFLWLRTGSDMDEVARQETISEALELFHDQYVDNPENLKKDGSFKREVIFINGYVEETELYILEWNLNEENPNILNNRSGNYF